MMASWFQPLVVAATGEIVAIRVRIDRYTSCFHFLRAA